MPRIAPKVIALVGSVALHAMSGSADAAMLRSVEWPTNDRAAWSRGALVGMAAQSWQVEFSQASWAPVASADVVGLAMAPVRASLEDAGAGVQVVPLRAYDLDAGAWWRDSVGMVVSARMVEDTVAEGPRALLADACVGWRVARVPVAVGIDAAVDVLAGVRVAAAPSGAPGAAVDLGRIESESRPVVGVRCRSEIAPGWTLGARADAVAPMDGVGAGWSVSAGVAAAVGGGWDLSLEAGWRSLDATLVDTLDAFGAGQGTGRGRGEGAVWLGLSKSF